MSYFAFVVSVLMGVGSIAYAYAGVGLTPIVRGLLILGALWLFAGRKHWTWFSTIVLLLLVLRDLSSGGDWADAITNCYVRMSEVVSRTRGLYRQEAMTPAEFAFRLERAGLPGDPVRRLTRLFEAVRYGARKPARNEINEAVSCLNAILQYCGEAA